MRPHEFLTPITEILTVHELVQPSQNMIDHVKDIANNKLSYYDDIYYSVYDNQLIVVCKSDDIVTGYTIGVMLKPISNTIDAYICPKNLYSWANDNGKTALKLIKSIILICKEQNIPVLSDIELTGPAKKFLKKCVESGNLTGKIFDLNTGTISKYDPNIWDVDDNNRVLFLEHNTVPFGKSLINEGTWNWKQLSGIV